MGWGGVGWGFERTGMSARGAAQRAGSTNDPSSGRTPEGRHMGECGAQLSLPLPPTKVCASVIIGVGQGQQERPGGPLTCPETWPLPSL